MTTLQIILVAIFSAGGALAINSIFKGVDSYRNGTARTEARGIKNLERYRVEADERAARIQHIAEFKQTLVDYYRNRAGDLEHVIRVNWGAENIPTAPPIPQMEPYKQLEKVKKNA